MKRKHLVVGVIGILLVAGAGALFLFPLDSTSTEIPFELGDSERSASSGEIRINGTLFVRYEATILGPEAAHVRQEYEQNTTEHFYEDGEVYTKFVSTAEVDRESIRSVLENDDEVVHNGHHGDRVVLVAKGQGTYDDGVWSTRWMTTRPLLSLTYDKVEDGSDGDYAVYKPSSAWIKLDRSLHRLDPERGTVRTDPETDVLRSMSLEVSMTQASSYGEYLLQGEPDSTLSAEYEYDPDPEPTALETPDWVEQCVKNDDCEF